jgi:hypothetical protein
LQGSSSPVRRDVYLGEGIGSDTYGLGFDISLSALIYLHYIPGTVRTLDAGITPARQIG